MNSPKFSFKSIMSVWKESGEAEAASVLDESENEAEKPMLFQSWCHLTMVPENNWVKLQKKQVCWKDTDEGKLL